MKTQNEVATAVQASSLHSELERQAFEHWYSDGGKWPRSIERTDDGNGYRLRDAHQAWQAWKARGNVQIVRGEYICPKCGLRQSLGIETEHAF